MQLLLLILLLHSVFLAHTNDSIPATMPYDELRILGGACPPRDTCTTLDSPEDDHLWGNRTCECGYHCVRRNTCCIDSPHAGRYYVHPPVEETCQKIPTTKFATYMVSGCPTRERNRYLIQNCTQSEEPNFIDPLMATPVTSLISKKTYKNYFCALCHQDVEVSVIWNIEILGLRPDQANEKDIASRLVFDADQGSWGIFSQRSGIQQRKPTPLTRNQTSPLQTLAPSSTRRTTDQAPVPRTWNRESTPRIREQEPSLRTRDQKYLIRTVDQESTLPTSNREYISQIRVVDQDHKPSLQRSYQEPTFRMKTQERAKNPEPVPRIRNKGPGSQTVDQKPEQLGKQGSFQKVKLGFAVPPSLRKIVKKCYSTMVTSCHLSQEDTILHHKCLAYYAPVRLQKGVSRLKFRNVHCGLCNNASAVVEDACVLDATPKKSKPKLNFALLLDVNMQDGDLVGKVQVCKDGQVMDPFFKKCRTLKCGRPNYVIKNKTCVKAE